jgi:hypothetical protein
LAYSEQKGVTVMKKAMFLSLMMVFGCYGVFAQAKFFWNVGGGLNITNSAPNFGVGAYKNKYSTSTGSSPTYIEEIEWNAGFGGSISGHVGIGMVKNISLETGVDLFINNAFSREITFPYYPGVIDSSKVKYHSVDIPVLVNLSVPVTGNFLLKPSIGLYMSFPFGLSVKYGQTGYAANIIYDQKFDIATKYTTGLQAGLKFEFFMKEVNGLVLGINYKRDFVHIYSSTKVGVNTYVCNITRQCIPIYIGYEREF